ncbi:MAG: DUF6508 domain-containing protein [Lachnospiraceae bacterium]|jgi:ADP-ribosylglycohydrolase|nr:DUF6508 domain-containing protein [Lachnospiraceae bacterium]MEE3462109.1 DUF6508 domain-containing protein [Lachnospiraceae bacterium]
MIGAIIGDAAGVFAAESKENIKDLGKALEGSHITGNTVVSLAAAKGLKHGFGNTRKTGVKVGKYFKELVEKYPDMGYEDKFTDWVSDYKGELPPAPYNTVTPDAAVRASSAAWVYNSLEYVNYYTGIVTHVTHKSSEASKAAVAVTSAIFLSRQGIDKKDIKAYLEHHCGIKLAGALDSTGPEQDKQGGDGADESGYAPIAAAVNAFLAATDFTDAIDRAVAAGLSTKDPEKELPAIAMAAGAIAESYYPVPSDLKEKALALLDDDLKAVLDSYETFLKKIRKDREKKFDLLFDCRPFFDKRGKTEWYAPKPVGDEKPFPYPKYGSEVQYLEEIALDKDFADYGYEDTLKHFGIEISAQSIDEHIDIANAYVLRSMLTAIIRHERFVDGTIAEAIRTGTISRILAQLAVKIRPGMF